MSATAACLTTQSTAEKTGVSQKRSQYPKTPGHPQRSFLSLLGGNAPRTEKSSHITVFQGKTPAGQSVVCNGKPGLDSVRPDTWPSNKQGGARAMTPL